MSSLQSSHQKGLRASCANSLLNTSMKEQKEGAASEAASSESWSFYCASLLPFIFASQQTMKRGWTNSTFAAFCGYSQTFYFDPS